MKSASSNDLKVIYRGDVSVNVKKMRSILEQVLAKGSIYGNHMEFFTNHAHYHNVCCEYTKDIR